MPDNFYFLLDVKNDESSVQVWPLIHKAVAGDGPRSGILLRQIQTTALFLPAGEPWLLLTKFTCAVPSLHEATVRLCKLKKKKQENPKP